MFVLDLRTCATEASRLRLCILSVGMYGICSSDPHGHLVDHLVMKISVLRARRGTGRGTSCKICQERLFLMFTYCIMVGSTIWKFYALISPNHKSWLQSLWILNEYEFVSNLHLRSRAQCSVERVLDKVCIYTLYQTLFVL